MKQLTLFLALMFSTFVLYGQRSVEKSIKVNSADLVFIEAKFADSVSFKTWSKNEVLIKAIVNINKNENNDKFEIVVESSNNQVNISAVINDLKEISEKRMAVIKNVGVAKNLLEIDMYLEIFVPEKKPLKFKSICANVILPYTSAEMNIKTISGFIDFSVPKGEGMNLSMKTISGSIFSNIEDKFHSTHKKSSVGQKAKGTLNGGGPEVTLKTISGDIFIREK